MSDLFKEKAEHWDKRPLSQVLSEGIGSALLEHVALRDTDQVMDFGAGTGLICAYVVPKVKGVVAVDISPSMLERLAQNPALQGKVETRCQDIQKEPIAQQFDLIISAMALHHVRETESLLKTFAQHLAPGGRIALADLDREDGSFHPANVEGVFHHGFDRTVLQQQLASAGFRNIQFVTAVEVEREDRCFPLFLVTAERGDTCAS